MTIIADWYPVTHDLGLIKAPAIQVVDAFVTWHKRIGIQYDRRSINTSLTATFESLPPLSAQKQRRVFVPTTSGWTAAFQSGIQGSDPFPAMSYLAREMGVLAMRVCCAPPNATYPAVIWEVYAPPELGGYLPLGFRRTISAANDGGKWTFDQQGEPYPFEQLELYSARHIRDRFPPEVLKRYLREFGLEPFADEFYEVHAQTPAVLLERTTGWVNRVPEFSLAETIAGKPWKVDGKPFPK